LKLRDVVNFRTGQLRHADRSSLANALKIRTDAHLIVTGIEQDRFVEPWWSLGRDRRAPLLRELAKLGIALVTPPNFSLFCDQPRPSDFSAMKRIARVQSEFQAAGIACSLHAHIRNETDSARWASFVAGRPEITSIAYEFTTGAGREPVRRMQVEHLIRLAKVADRPMDLVLRGDTGVVTELVGVYRHLVYIDTNAFMKTVNRQKAVRTGNEGLTWKANKTPKDVPLDALLQHNVDEVTLAGRQMLTRSV
jgi:hypothetical protein